MSTPNPMASMPALPIVSKTTVPMSGILVDVYGLEELSASTTSVSALWLHHGRGRTRDDMSDFAARCVAAWNQHPSAAAAGTLTSASGESEGGADHGGSRSKSRGLIALAFDQRNHNSRLVHPPANNAWRAGNDNHAVDMFGLVSGTVADTRSLMDLVDGYLFVDGRARVVQHIVLGVSLGGHVEWQLMFAEPRVTVGVIIVGCPDYMYLMKDRARLSKRKTFKPEDGGASFLGSRDFPPGLVEGCRKLDPKGIVFSTSSPSWPDSSEDEKEKSRLLQTLVGDKKFLICSGADDKLVPYRCSKPFLDFFKRAAKEWQHTGYLVEDIVYPNTGHVFSPEMVKDSIRFITDAIVADEKGWPRGEDRTSKI